MSDEDELVPSKDEVAHIMTIVTSPPSLRQWKKTHEKTVERLEEKYDMPLREILKECGKVHEPKFPGPPRSS